MSTEFYSNQIFAIVNKGIQAKCVMLKTQERMRKLYAVRKILPDVWT